MDQSLEDLRQALRKLRQDIETQVRSGQAEPETDAAPAEHDAPARKHDPQPVPARDQALGLDDLEGRPAPIRLEDARRDEDLSAAVLRSLPTQRTRAQEPAGSEPGSRGILPKVLQASGLGAAAAGAFIGNGAVTGAGLLLSLAGALAGGLSPAASADKGDDEVRELALRIAALERRGSLASRASEAGSLPREVIEEVVELRRILTSLFKALEKPSGRS
ncbi:MAG: hypothetical protein HY924_15245 [Elusimicrobia bacterium]|nr:hypothetical protein [Elusimicrobiota bacterium]